MKLDLIIFDCDGTLADSEYLNNKAVIDILNEYGLTQYTLEHAYHEFMGKALSVIVSMVEAESQTKIPSDFAQVYQDRVNDYQKTLLRPIAGALDCVNYMGKHVPVCVASNGERSNVIRSLEALGFMAHFTEDTVFTKIQVKRPKPFPDLFEFAARTMKAPDPSRVLVIEDSVAGVSAGKAAGMRTYGFVGVSHNPQAAEVLLKDAGAEQVFHSYEALQNQMITLL